MKVWQKVLIVLGLGVAVAVILGTKKESRTPKGSSEVQSIPGTTQTPSVRPEGDGRLAAATRSKPKLVDVGAGKCVACQAMVPVLEELKARYSNQLEVVYYDISEHRDLVRGFEIRIIPTQIFLAPDGRELFRHEGFFGKDEIVGKWKELGFDFHAEGAR